MSDDLPDLTSLTENSTDLPVSSGGVENYVLLLVLLGVFAGGTLVLLSLLVLFCNRCGVGGRRYSRASDDPEKTNTTYVEDSQPTQEITIRLDESDGLSASSCHDGETERFVSTGSTGRRVSFNESALYEQERRTQDKGRRYTLTEGDFHHLKKARLTHLHLAPAPSALKILTIMECDSTESSTINISELPVPRMPLAIYQPPERGKSPDWTGQSLSGGLPGDPHHSVVLHQSDRRATSGLKTQRTRSQTSEAVGDQGGGVRRGSEVALVLAPTQASVLHFFSKLRRHASLEGAGPYFKKWKFDSSHRAASLDAKGSPKRKPFQRQRAASDTTDHTEENCSPLRDDITSPLTQSLVQSSGLQSLSAESLPQATTPLSPSEFFNRLEMEAMAEAGGVNGTRRDRAHSPTDTLFAQRREQATCEETEVALEVETERETQIDSKLGAVTSVGVARLQLAPADEDVEEDDLFEERVEVGGSGNIKTVSLGNKTAGVKSDHATSGVKKVDETRGDEVAEEGLGAVARLRADSGSSLSFVPPQESSEVAPSLYRDIWSLRASLEQYASSDQSSTDRESVRSDADSVSSLGAAGARSGLHSCLSQDLDDEPDGEGDGEGGLAVGVRRASGDGDGDMASGAGGEGEAGSRKLLQMDSGYASIEAPSRVPEELRLFGNPGGHRGKTASERRLYFTSSGRKGSVCESFEARLFQEELEDEMASSLAVEQSLTQSPTASPSLTLKEAPQLRKATYPQSPLEPPQLQSQPTSPLLKPLHPVPQPSAAHRPRLRRRDYSIDEKTDALFNEFLRHDPRFDQQDSPPRSRHRSRVHLRKQWQRHKQYSDPGSGTGGRYSPSLERQRFTPLRRGDSAGYPLDTRYHSTLSRIASAADEEANEVAACEEGNKEAIGDKGPADGSVSEDKDESKVDTSCTASTSSVTASKPVARESTPDPLQCPWLGMDPQVGNQNNNSSQAIQSDFSHSKIHPPLALSTHANTPAVAILQGQSSVADKLAASLDERLYSGLRSVEQHHGGTECVVAVLHTASPDKSPV